MAEQKINVDFLNGGDTGEDNITAIQPVSNAEGANQTVFRRPSENLRSRTEILREEITELKRLRDSSPLMFEYTGGTLTWNGPGPGASPLGEITVTGGTLKISPFLAPSTATKGSLSIGTPGTNEITYSVAAGTYATEDVNGVYVSHVDGGAATTLAVTISDGPLKHIVVAFDSTNIAHDASATKALVDVAIAADSDLAGKITTTTNALANNIIDAAAHERLEGTADDESHWVSGSDIEALTQTTPLEPGMGIAIWYRYLIEPAAGYGSDPKAGLAGGRAESSVDRGTNVIPAGSLFVTDADPDKIPGAIAICRVGYDGQLIWADGTRVATGETISFTSVKTQIDVEFAALAAATGSGVGVNASFSAAIPTQTGLGGIGTGITTLDDALSKIDTALIRKRAWTAVLTDGTTSQGGDYNGADATDVLFDGTTYPQGGIFVVRNGDYTLTPTINSSYVNRTTVLGESQPLFGETNTTLTVDASETTNKVIRGHWENVEFATASATYGFETATSLGITLNKCRIPLGAFDIEPTKSFTAIDCEFYSGNAVFTNDGDLTIKGPSYFKRCSFAQPRTAALALMTIDPGSGFNTGSIVFEDCDFYIPGTPTNTAFNLIRFETANGGNLNVVFRNCRLNVTATNHVAHLLYTTGHDYSVLFEDCYFFAQSGGLMDMQSSNCTFKDCTMKTGDGTITTYLQALSLYGPSGTGGLYAHMRNVKLELGTKSVDSAGTANINNYPMVSFGKRLDGASTPARIQYRIDNFSMRYSSAVTNMHAATSVVFWGDGNNSGNDPRSCVKNFYFNAGTAPGAANGNGRGVQGGDSFLVEFLGSASDTPGVLSGSRIMAENIEIFGPGKSDVASDKRGFLRVRDTEIRTLRVHFSGTSAIQSLAPDADALIYITKSHIDEFRLQSSSSALCDTSYLIYLAGQHSSSGIGNARFCRVRGLYSEGLSWAATDKPSSALIGMGPLSELRDSELLNVVRNKTGSQYVIKTTGTAGTNISWVTIDGCLITCPSNANNANELLSIEYTHSVRITNNKFLWNTTGTGAPLFAMVLLGINGFVISNNISMNYGTDVIQTATGFGVSGVPSPFADYNYEAENVTATGVLAP